VSFLRKVLMSFRKLWIAPVRGSFSSGTTPVISRPLAPAAISRRSFLGFESFGGSYARSRAEATAVLASLNNVAAGAGAPLDPAPRVAIQRNVAPAAWGLHLFQDIDACHRAPPLAERALLWTLRKGSVNNYFVFISLRQPDL
jgi:hypothetical protein